MPNAYCLVDGYQTNLQAVNVSPSSSVIIYLNDDTGVNDWSITCFDTDELQDSTNITNSLSVNQLNKTASFTFPSESTGSTLLFRSVINNGIDVNGKVQTGYSYEFAICSLSPSNLRLLAKNETIHTDRVFGWIVSLNKLIRA